jgi:Protein of unknown function (DUF4232)
VAVKRFLVPTAVLVVAIAVATTAGVFVKRHVNDHGGLPSLVLNGGSTTCYLAELRFSYFGTKATAGSEITGFRVTDKSMLPCALSGNPLLGFYGGPPQARTPLRAKVKNLGPGAASTKAPVTIVLQPGSTRAAAAFVITSSVSRAAGSANCSRLTAIEIGLYPQGARTTLPVPFEVAACGTPPHISISDFFSSESLDSRLGDHA